MEISQILGDQRTNDIRSRLNLGGRGAVAIAWEVVVLAALNRRGKIKPIVAGQEESELDTLFEPANAGMPAMVEVTAISDDGLHNENPVNEFTSEISVWMHRRGFLDIGAVDFRFGHVETPSGPRIGVPRKGEFGAFLNSDAFRQFCLSIKKAPTNPSSMIFTARGVTSSIVYKPKTQFSSASFPMYRDIFDEGRNPLIDRLRKKARQIGKSDHDLPAIVVVCDAGSYALSTIARSQHERKIDRMIHKFLNGLEHVEMGPWLLQKGCEPGTSRIDAVVLVSIKERGSMLGGKSEREIHTLSFTATRAASNRRLQETVSEVASFAEFAPPVRRMPINAKSRIRRPAFYGASSMSLGDSRVKIKFSLATIQQLLAGKIAFEQFQRDHADLVAQIARAEDEGKLISDVKIEECPDHDDDWIELEFSRVQPARLFDKDVQ